MLFESAKRVNLLYIQHYRLLVGRVFSIPIEEEFVANIADRRSYIFYLMILSELERGLLSGQ